jgi:general secretion pathway protein E
MSKEQKDELAYLQKFAEAGYGKVYTSQSDLNPKDKPMVEMHAWCTKYNDIVVLNSGLILSNNPASRNVQNCKIIMLNKGRKPAAVVPASRALIAMLLANSSALVGSVSDNENSAESVSEQQQRLRHLVHEALLAQSSDIHIEVRDDLARIRFRKHGELYLHAEWMPKLAREIASVAFNKETDHAVSHFNPMVPQSASMSLRIDGHDVRLRLASLPAHHGFDVVLRVLTVGEDNLLPLKDLGYRDDQIQLLTKAIHMPNGAILIAGPTGSGKTTTIASCLQMIAPHRKVYTIEEPVEKVINTITQIPVNTEHDDRGFVSMARAALRMDPDVIALGEMRDEETARVMVRAALTGHLVLSTLHTNSATGIVTRLVDMGISSSLLADNNVLLCLICQRLVPTLCNHCATPLLRSDLHKPHLERWKKQMADHFDQIRVRGHQCRHCKGTGLDGRTVIAEIIWVDEISRKYIQQVDTLGWEIYLKQQGWVNYRDQANDLVRSGRSDPLDVERVIGDMD